MASMSRPGRTRVLRNSTTSTCRPGHLAVGTEIVVDGYQSKDGSNRANGRDITFTDGRKLFLGSNNPGEGAPEAAPDKK